MGGNLFFEKNNFAPILEKKNNFAPTAEEKNIFALQNMYFRAKTTREIVIFTRFSWSNLDFCEKNNLAPISKKKIISLRFSRKK